MPLSASVRLRLLLGSTFAHLTNASSLDHVKLQQALETELAERLKALGVRGTPEVEIIADAAEPESIRWFVQSRECRYPQEIPSLAWSFVQDRLAGSEGAERGWLRSTAEKRVSQENLLFWRLFVSAVLELQPLLLLGPEQVEEYVRQIAPAANPGTVRGFDLALGQVLDMGLSLEDIDRIAPTLEQGWAKQDTPADLAERLIADLASDPIEIHANRELVKRVSLQASGGEKPLQMMRHELFNELGMIYPRLRFIARDAMRDGTFAFKFHGWMTIPRVGLAPEELLVNIAPHRLQPLGIKGGPRSTRLMGFHSV